MHYLIIGNSAAGCAAIEPIREKEPKARITVVCDEPYNNYSRPLISYLLGKKISRDKLFFLSDKFYRDNQVNLLLNKKAVKLDLENNNVVFADKHKISFDKLLIATGGKPIPVDILKPGLPGVFTFTKLNDALAIDHYIQANKVKKAVVVGGGLIGLKATEALMERGIKVSIVELADRILSATFDIKASAIIEQALQKNGCVLMARNMVREIRVDSAAPGSVVLQDQTEIPADLVIVAAGVAPNVDLVKDTAIKADRGILVDNFMQTTVKGVYACGDCVQAKDMFSPLRRNIAIWPLAVKQGRIAGYNICGSKKEYSGGLAMNAVELAGVATISVGQTAGGEDCQVLADFRPQQSIYRKLVLKDDRIIGAILIGDIERAGIYTGLIKDKIDVSGIKESLLSQDFGLISLPKEYRKHLVFSEAAII